MNKGVNNIYSLESIINNIEQLYQEYDKITNLKENIDKTNKFIQQVDSEIQSVLEDIKHKEGKIQRLNILTQIKYQLTQTYKDMITQYTDIIKQKMEINKFLVTKLSLQEQEGTPDEHYIQMQYKQVFDILDNIQRKDKNKQELIREIMNEMSTHFEDNKE